MASYLILYDATSAGQLEFQLLAFVKNNRHVTQWLRPFSGCYLMKSTSDLNAISASFAEFFGTATQHIITSVGSATTGGMLPGYAWEWLNQPDPPALGDLLAKYLEAPSDKKKLGFGFPPPSGS